jgi:hypothetical protein
MPKPLPGCKNRTCPSYGKNEQVILLKETPQEAVFGCKVCYGVEVRTLDWRRGQMGLQHQRYGRPEWARTKAFFDLSSKRNSNRSY